MSAKARGARFAELSRCVPEVISPLYIVHLDPMDHLEPMNVPTEDTALVEQLARGR